jgi:uncharacterized membrane protein
MVAQFDDGHTPEPFIDLKLVTAAVLLTVLTVSVPVVRNSPIRVVTTLGFILFVPGYALIAALFPEQNTLTDPQRADSDIGHLERVVLSFGASIAIIALSGLALNFTPWGISFVPVVISLSGLTLGLTALAAVRRQQVAANARFTVPLPTLHILRDGVLNPVDRTDTVLNIVLTISLLVAASTVTFAVVAPTQGETFTELSILTKTDRGGLTADNYPTNLTQGESQSLVVTVTNHESKQISYTLVVELQRISVDSGDIDVLETAELHRLSRTLNDNETWRQPHTITPKMTGEHLRLQYSLYQGDGPTGQANGAYRTVHLWINVSKSNIS